MVEGLFPIRQRAQATPEDLAVPGLYLPGEAEGAYPNGTRVTKVDAEEGDGTALGMGGVVLSSLDARDIEVGGIETKVDYFYFVKWDDFPQPIGIVDWKIGKEGAL